MLKTDYKDDVFSGQKKYTMINNDDGTVSFADATTYSQVGDYFGASNINETNETINKLSTYHELTQTLSTTIPTDFVFTNSLIRSSSAIQVIAFRTNGDVSGEQNSFRYSDINTTDGQCIVTYPKFQSSISLTVRIYIK